MTHPIIDTIIQIKNGYMAQKEEIELPHSRFKEDVLKKLIKLGFIENCKTQGKIKKKIIIKLKYDNGIPAFNDVKIFSKPGRRWYVSYKELKPVMGRLGCSILSTSKGILTGDEAKKEKIGGELLFNIW